LPQIAIPIPRANKKIVAASKAKKAVVDNAGIEAQPQKC
jgi:hypothetical protein